MRWINFRALCAAGDRRRVLRASPRCLSARTDTLTRSVAVMPGLNFRLRGIALLALKHVAGMPIHDPRSFWQYLKKT